MKYLLLFFSLIFYSLTKANGPCSSHVLTVGATCSFSLDKTEPSTNPGGCTVGTNPNNKGVWLSIIVPASGNVQIDTDVGEFSFGCMAVFSGPNCSSLTEIACDNAATGMPSIGLSGRTPGETLWIFVWQKDAGPSEDKGFKICAWDNPILPVELLYFDAELLKKNQVNLTWKTATEINNDYFIIQRSLNTQTWEEIGQINGAGNSSQILTYNYIDNNPYTGISYYRLKQTDFNNAFSYSQIKVINSKELFFINTFPNPSSGEFNFSIYSKNEDLIEVNLYNNLGQLIKNQKLLVNEGINLFKRTFSYLNKGNYTIQINSSNKLLYDYQMLIIKK